MSEWAPRANSKKSYEQQRAADVEIRNELASRSGPGSTPTHLLTIEVPIEDGSVVCVPFNLALSRDKNALNNLHEVRRELADIKMGVEALMAIVSDKALREYWAPKSIQEYIQFYLQHRNMDHFARLRWLTERSACVRELEQIARRLSE